MRLNIANAKASTPGEGFVPNPKLKLLDQVSEVMRFKHYSLRTERTYRDWIKRFILFHGKRHPRDMGGVEVGSFLSDLAVRHQVAASTQNQALNALVFLYGQVLQRELGQIGTIERAQRPQHLPTVLTRPEVDRVLTAMSGTHQLMAKLVGRHLQACKLPLPKAQFRNPPARNGLRHPHRPGTARSQQCPHHSDLHPCHGQTRPRRTQPIG